MSTDATAPPPFNPSSCAACRVIDASDGVEDGSLFASSISGVPNEHWLWYTLRRAEDRSADRITIFAGSMRFVYIHAIWFSVWILVNIGLAGAGWEFDSFPFGLLTMIVSLEAIFLATFVMISQNRQAQRSDLRAEIDFETNLRAAIWSVHIGEALGIDTDHVEGVVRHALHAAREHLEQTDPRGRPGTAASRDNRHVRLTDRQEGFADQRCESGIAARTAADNLILRRSRPSVAAEPHKKAQV